MALQVNLNAIPAVQPPVAPQQGTVGLWMWSNGRYLLVKPLTQADQVHHTAFKASLQVYLRALPGLEATNVEKACIDYANGCIIYQTQGAATKRTVSLQEASQDPALKTQIDAMKVIAKRLWGGDIAENTIALEHRSYALGENSNAFLDKISKEDCLLKEVVKQQLVDQANNIVPTRLDPYLETLSTAKQLKNEFKDKVKVKKEQLEPRVEELKRNIKTAQETQKQTQVQLEDAEDPNATQRHTAALQNVSARITQLEAQLKPLQKQLDELQEIYAELEDNWDETTLPVLLAYRSKHQHMLNTNGAQGYTQIAERMQGAVDTVYQREFEKETATSIKHSLRKTFTRNYTDPVSRKPGNNMASAFISAGAHRDLEESRGHGDEYIRNKTGVVKEKTRFMDAFIHHIFHYRANPGDGRAKYNRAVQRFNAFLNRNFGAAKIRECYIDTVHTRTHPALAAIRAEKARLRDVITPPAPNPELHPDEVFTF